MMNENEPDIAQGDGIAHAQVLIPQSEPLRILLLEDSPTDAELNEHLLRKAGINFTALRVETGSAFVAALDTFHPDIILADYKLPEFDGMAALQIVRRDHPEVPVIMVTGALSDIEAVELIHAGAKDYMLKDRPARLAAAVQRALAIEQGIRARKAAELALRESEEKFHAIFENAEDGIVLTDAESGLVADCNPEFERQCGRSLTQIRKLHVWELRPPEQQEAARRKFEEIREAGHGSADLGFLRPDGSFMPAEVVATRVCIGERNYLISISRDITERRQAEDALASGRATLEAALAGMSDAVFISDTEGRFIHFNDAFATFHKFKKREECARTLAEYPEFLEVYSASGELLNLEQWAVPRALRGESGVGVEFTLKRKDTGETWVGSYNYAPIRDKEGTITGSVVTGRDVTLQKQSEAIILATQAQLQRMLDAANQSSRVLLSVLQDQKRAETATEHANRALATLSAVNRSLVHATNEKELFQSICQAIVQQRGYKLAWVGYVRHDESKSIEIVAHTDHQAEDYLDALKLTWAPSERGMGPSGRAVRSGVTQLCNDMAHDPYFSPWREAALQHGFASSIVLALKDANAEVFGILNVYAAEPNAFIPSEISLLEEMAGDLAFGVRTLHVRAERDLAQQKIQQQMEKLQESLESTVRVIAQMVEIRDPYTAGHQNRVADLAAAIARRMNLPDERIHGLQMAGIVHDLGKIQIPAEILSKPGKISEIEFSLIKGHARAGYEILKDIDFPWPIAQMVLQHHERLDGSGYPQGLKGEAILLEARILSVADVVEAMSSHRPYRPGLGINVALEEIGRGRGTHYDPQVVDACLTLFREKGYAFPARTSDGF